MNLTYKKTLIILVMFLLGATTALAACVVPYENMQITQSTTLCSGTYYLNDADGNGAIQIAADNVVLDCNGAKIVGVSSINSSAFNLDLP